MTRTSTSLRLGLLLLILLLISAVALRVGGPSPAQLRRDFAGTGVWGGVGFAGAYAAATLSPLPKSIFTLAAGAVFGLAAGLVVVVAGAMIGALTAFYLGRALGHDGVRRFTGVRADRFDGLLERRGLLVMLGARLVPIVPFTALNYISGLTVLRLRTFTVGTAIGILPATTAYVAVGAYGGSPGSWQLWLAIASLATLSVSGAIVGWRHRRAGALPWASPSKTGSERHATPTDPTQQ